MVFSQHCPKDASDEELVELTKANKDNFACLMARYETKLTRYINKLTNVSDEEVEDLLQEIFIKTYKNINDFDTGLKFSSWIYRIAHNHIISKYRSKQARPQTVEIDADLYQNLAGELDVHSELEDAELKEHVLKTIDSLKGEYREVLYLKYFEEKSYEELSDILAKPMGTVASMIHSAKKSFKKQWDNKYGSTN